MALTPSQLKNIVAEARPIIERHLDDAELLVGFRTLVADAGGDWSALKALITAQVKDERDESGDDKHVRKVLEKAGWSEAYAVALGVSLNEGNVSSGDEE